MNVYDFDGTIFYSDCSIGFALWCLKRHPKLWFTYVPGLIKNLILYKTGMIPNYLMQRKMFGYLTMIDDFDEQIERYWDKYEKRISEWYMAQKRPDDLIISASPSCIIGPIAHRLGVNYMATEYDREFGVFVNNLMYGKEKAKYIIDHGFPMIENFYSDSLADTPLALCAEKAYLVKNNATTVVNWPNLDEETMKTVKSKIDTGWNIHLKEKHKMYIVIYDFGTSSVKTCLFDIDEDIRLVTSSTADYGLYISDDGGAEQDTEEWWEALCSTTRKLFKQSDVKPWEIKGMAACTQFQGSVFVDENGNALRRPMNYLDQRGIKEYKECMGSGIIKVSGCSLYKLGRNLMVNYAGSVSAKDPVWKYKWVENNETEVFQKAYKWLDICDYLIARFTGRIVRTADSAFATFLYDTRRGKEGWNKDLLKMYKVNPRHMPDIIESTDLAGELTEKAAKDLGLVKGIPVYAGGGDTTFVNIGAGCTRPGDTHIYIGTSGWVSTYMDHQAVDINAMITGVLSAKRGYFNYYAELETAGKCFEWVMEHLALDEIGIYLNQYKITDDIESRYTSLYDYLSSVISKVPPGAHGVIFTPWLHGNRCPFEDSNAAGMFFNIKIDTGKKDMLRAVLEGICYHLRWLLECEDKKVRTSDPIRFVGGGALSPVTCQMLADITGRRIETVNNSQEVGAIGTALIVAAGIEGVDVDELSRRLVKVNNSYTPDPENREAYERNYRVFKKLYKSNAANFKALNRR